MKNRIITIVLVLMLFVGVSLLLYPTVSNYWNSFHQTKAIAGYAKAVAEMNNDEYEHIIENAMEYNKSLMSKQFRWKPTKEEADRYNKELNISGTGIMGYIEIPEINVSLPIYHGTSEGVLNIAVGHIEGSSLPIGGKGTHSVLSGHRGLPSAKLFTNLDRMTEGDTFIIRVLDEVYTYEVDKILIVEPDDMSSLTIDPEQDYCTLVTCTPYAVNTHRLLVRGHRIANAEEAKEIRVTADAVQIEPVVVAPAVAAPILIVLFVVMMVTTGKNKNNNNKKD